MLKKLNKICKNHYNAFINDNEGAISIEYVALILIAVAILGFVALFVYGPVKDSIDTAQDKYQTDLFNAINDNP